MPHIGKEQGTKAITMFDGCPCQQGGCMTGCYGFEQILATEKHGAALIEQDKDRLFLLFTVNLGVHIASTCGDTPVDGANLVTWLIGAYFIKVEAAPAHHRLLAAIPLATAAVSERKTQAVCLAFQGDQLTGATSDASDA